MHGHGVLVFILWFFGKQVCHGIHIGQKNTDTRLADFPVHANDEGLDNQHNFILVSGVEGSGTTMMTKILSECSTCIGFNSDWKISELTLKAQRKYTDGMKELRGQFDRVTDELWKDSASKPYILQKFDARNPNMLVEGRNRAATILNTTFALHNFVHNVIHHRSMPHGPTRLITPFLEDLPYFVPRSLAHVVIVCRFMPASWISHSRFADYAPFLERVERLMDGSEMIPGVFIHFVSYEYLCCHPKSALAELAAELPGIDITDLISSPAVASIESIVKDHYNTEYQTKLGALTRMWETVRPAYPKFDQFQRAGESRCQKALSKLGFSEEVADGVLSRIHQRIENNSGS